MVPWQFKDFSQSIVATTFFSSNILFSLESGYFAGAAEQKPLLHTWSLAVEEQFYLFFPLLLAFLWPFGAKRTLRILIAIALASLIFSEWAWRHIPVYNFYLPMGRIWELFAGSFCAFIIFEHGRKSNGALAFAGLALILYSIFFYDSNTPFPSVYALVPVVGTALIILYATQDNITGRLLSASPLVGIGLISYSAYLWHQPLFAFARIRSFLSRARCSWVFSESCPSYWRT